MTQPTPTAAPPALLNITLGVMLALMLGWFFHIASGVLVPMVLGLMISYVVPLSCSVSYAGRSGRSKLIRYARLAILPETPWPLLGKGHSRSNGYDSAAAGRVPRR